MEKNIFKRLIIILIYAIIFSLIVWFFYSIFKIKETCLDGIKNQNEEDVDCGGICTKQCEKNEALSLTIGETGAVESSVAGEYDFFGVVINPNNNYGSEYFAYQIKFKDENEAILGERQGSSFILPGDKKYIVENSVKINKLPAKIEFNIADSRWMEAADLYKKPDLKIVNRAYNEISSGVGFFEASGLLKNESPFDFALIKIKIILKDAAGKIIALNGTDMRTVNSGENRDFRVFWPGRFSGEVANMETQVEVNVFDSDSFARKYFNQEKFQEY
ncbi:MAG TPA: hypothetical protein DCS28_00125 [Candidatus Moranbacteria bacterium]|nr:hypothetical protein [Candidatus Moranbacteria bacterium]HAT74441.1 hypothetical protein [Candidatus Moranbacteria bacterium]